MIKLYVFYANTKINDIKYNEVGQYKSQRDKMQDDYDKMLKDKESIDKKFVNKKSFQNL